MKTHEWVVDGRAKALPGELSDAFDRYLCALPWVGSSLDWTKLPPPEQINVVRASPDEMRAWLSRTAIGGHSHIVVWYSAREGGIVVPLEVGFEHLDELYGAEPRYCFGLDIVRGAMKPVYEALLEYGKGDLYSAVSAAGLSRMPRMDKMIALPEAIRQLIKWYRNPAAGRPEVFAESFTYRSQIREDDVERWCSTVEAAGGWRDLTIVGSVGDAFSGAVFLEGTDPVTALRTRIAWWITGRHGKLVSLLDVRSSILKDQ